MQNLLLWMLCSIATVTLTLGLVSALALTEQSQRAMLWWVHMRAAPNHLALYKDTGQ